MIKAYNKKGAETFRFLLITDPSLDVLPRKAIFPEKLEKVNYILRNIKKWPEGFFQ